MGSSEPYQKLIGAVTLDGAQICFLRCDPLAITSEPSVNSNVPGLIALYGPSLAQHRPVLL